MSESTSTSSEARRYEVGPVLGRGGFGTVYRATLIGSGGFSKDVALKVLNQQVEGTTELVARLRDEARMLGLLRHRAIIQVDGLVKLDGRWVVVMEFVDGVSLNRPVEAGLKLPIGVALEIVEEVASALHVAWAKPMNDGKPLQLQHRDIKPSNIQVTPEGEVKLLDFGVARADFDSREAETRAVVYGSLPYMSPERLEFRDSDRSDIYALGVTLFELLVGRFPGETRAHPERHGERVAEAMGMLRERTDDEALLAFVERCLAYDPEQRPSAREFERQARTLRRDHAGVYLKDWAEEAVPPLMNQRLAQMDELSGEVLSEYTGPLNPDGKASAGLDATFALYRTGESVLPKAPGRVSKKKKKRGRHPLALFLYALLGVGVVVVALFLGLVLLTGGGLAGLVALAWDDASARSLERSFIEMDDMMEQVEDGPQRTRMKQLLKQGQVKAHGGTISMWEMTGFKNRLEDATEDGRLTEMEVDVLEQRLTRIAAD